MLKNLIRNRAMKQISTHNWLVAIITVLLLTMSVSSWGAEGLCSFSAQEHLKEYSFTVDSKPDGECSKQLLSVALQYNARLVAQLEKKTDKLAEAAWAADLDDDGKPELVVVSHIPANPAVVTLDVYVNDSGKFHQITMPAAPDQAGIYRGGDRFSRDGDKIVRSYPLYKNSDRDGAPTGGKRVLAYLFRNRQLLPVINTQKDSVASAAAGGKKAKAGKQKPSKPVSITGIDVKQEYIEIKADGPIENYKVTRIAEPWRLIIDIPKAKTTITPGIVAIDKHGVSKARIGVNKGVLRIVFDSNMSLMPPETVTPEENGIRVGFYPVGK